MIAIRNRSCVLLLTLVSTAFWMVPIAHADGTISGSVIDADTGLGFALCIGFFDDQGNWVTQACPPDGVYTSPVLLSGTYYVKTDNWTGYYEEVWNDVPCNPQCDVTTGTPIVVGSAAVTGIDFALQPGGGNFAGTVVNELTGDGLMGPVFVYDGTGSEIGFGWALPPMGIYTTHGALETGTYYAIAAPADFVAELYDEIPCPDSSCNPLTGDPISVTAGQTSPAVDFTLRTISVFADNFETGDPGRWSTVVP